MGDLLISICLGYGALLFLIAYAADRRAARGHFRWLNSPLVYTLSLSIYCTAWTFYGAVGSAANMGLGFLAIYLGPTILFSAWWVILRKIVKIGKENNITSIADFISTRYGKDTRLAMLVTMIMLTATTPYIALQLQSIAQSFTAFSPAGTVETNTGAIAFWSALGLSIFAILFGTRNALVNERHSGVVAAVAFEAIIKLVAMILAGLFAVKLLGGATPMFQTDAARVFANQSFFNSRWVSLVSLSFMAILVLPRMFHVLVVENREERHLSTASWAFPLYLFILNLMVVPIAIAGTHFLPNSPLPDYFSITLPLAFGADWVAYFAFLGGFSAATSMVIMTAIALSIMVSNHIFMPTWLRLRGVQQNEPEDVRNILLRSRRISIGLVLCLGYFYYRFSGGSDNLASVGVIAFAGVAQVFPALIAGIFWQNANKRAVYLALLTGFALWLYTLFLPSFDGNFIISKSVIDDGPFSISWLRPYHLFNTGGGDPLAYSIVWSLGANSIILLLGSIFFYAGDYERLQAHQFIQADEARRHHLALHRASRGDIEDFYHLSNRILGANETYIFFQNQARLQDREGRLPVATDQLIEALENRFSGIIGGAAANALIVQLAGTGTVPISEWLRFADETVQNVEYANELQRQSKELEQVAQKLREANSTLVALDAQKDAFLSQVSHELRSPMTAIKSFTEILRDNPDLTPDDRARMLDIVGQESDRLTRLLDEILDLSFLESGRIKMARVPVNVQSVMERAIASTEPVWKSAKLSIQTSFSQDEPIILGDFDRLAQVFINLITNAAKYTESNEPRLHIQVQSRSNVVNIHFRDNGKGVNPEDRERIFEKFARAGKSEIAGSAGLGLAISREIIENMNGRLELTTSVTGAHFLVTLPKTKIQ